MYFLREENKRPVSVSTNASPIADSQNRYVMRIISLQRALLKVEPEYKKKVAVMQHFFDNFVKFFPDRRTQNYMGRSVAEILSISGYTTSNFEQKKACDSLAGVLH